MIGAGRDFDNFDTPLLHHGPGSGRADFKRDPRGPVPASKAGRMFVVRGWVCVCVFFFCVCLVWEGGGGRREARVWAS